MDWAETVYREDQGGEVYPSYWTKGCSNAAYGMAKIHSHTKRNIGLLSKRHLRLRRVQP